MHVFHIHSSISISPFLYTCIWEEIINIIFILKTKSIIHKQRSRKKNRKNFHKKNLKINQNVKVSLFVLVVRLKCKLKLGEKKIYNTWKLKSCSLLNNHIFCFRLYTFSILFIFETIRDDIM